MGSNPPQQQQPLTNPEPASVGMEAELDLTPPPQQQRAGVITGGVSRVVMPDGTPEEDMPDEDPLNLPIIDYGDEEDNIFHPPQNYWLDIVPDGGESINYREQQMEGQPLLPQDGAQAASEVGKGVLGGIYQGMILAPANLVDWGFSNVAKGVAGAITGKSAEELEAESPGLYKELHRDLPDWLKTETGSGDLVNNISQFVAPFGLLGKLGQAGKVAGWAGNIQKTIKSTNIGGKLAQYAAFAAKELPGLAKLADKGGKLTSLAARDAWVNFANFDANEGNIFNGLASLVGDKPGLMKDVADYLKVKQGDNELEGRVKNAFASHLGETVGFAGFQTAKLAKRLLQKDKLLMEAVDEIGKDATKLGKWQKIIQKEMEATDATSAEFQKVAEDIRNTDVNAILDDLLNGGTKKEVGEQAGEKTTQDITLEGTLDEGSGNISVEALEQAQKKVDDAVERGELAIIKADDNIQDALEKITAMDKLFVKGPKVKEDLRKGIEEVLKATGEQAPKKFDHDRFIENVTEKLEAGEPVDLGEELAEAIGREDLQDINTYLKTWGGVVEATTRVVKRVVSNSEQKNQMKQMLVSATLDKNLGEAEDRVIQELLDSGIDSLSGVKQAIIDRIGLDLMYKQVITPRLGRLLADRWTANIIDDKGLVKKLDDEIKPLAAWATKIRRLDALIRSEAGRLLQSIKTKTTQQDAFDIIEEIRKARNANPGVSEEDILNSPLGLDILSRAAKNLVDNTDFSSVGANARLGKNFTHFYNAMQSLADGSGAVASWGLSSLQESFYNNVLGSFTTLKAIAWSNTMVKGFELASQVTGAGVRVARGEQGEMETLLRARDEIQGIIRYMGEGISAGFTVLKTGQKAELDFTPDNPRVISADGLNSKLMDTIFEKPGLMANRVVDILGNVVNFPTAHMVGGVDTAFRVANQRAMLWTELKTKARFRGLNEADATQYAADHIDDVTHDLILARGARFDGNKVKLKQQEFSISDLELTHNRLVNETDKMTLSKQLGSSDYSDRWLFKRGKNLDDLVKGLGIVGTWEMPFVKVMFNAIQYGVDMNPALHFMNGRNRQIMEGVYGQAEKSKLLGKYLLSSVLGLTGIAAANSGMMAPEAGSVQARKVQQSLTGQGQYTMRLPHGNGSSIVLNFRKGTPLSDAVFMPGHLFQLASESIEGHLDPGASVVAGMSMMVESFNSGSFLRGAAISLDSFLNPTYSTADNLKRNVWDSFFGSVFTPRYLQDAKRLVDPYYRDFHSNLEYTLSRTPGISNTLSPTYDMFGNPRPDDDYIGSTGVLALDATKAVTSVGIKYVQDDPMVRELERFGKQGLALVPPMKTQNLHGVTIPLDQFKNSKGESLWDAFNNEMATLQFPMEGGGKGSIRDWMNALIQSDAYQKVMKDNEISTDTGKRSIYKGSRWAELSGRYSEAKEYTRQVIGGKPEYLNDYKNRDGRSVLEIIQSETIKKAKVGG